MQVTCFCVGEAEYAIDIMRVREVIQPTSLIQVPHAPAFVEGLLELRGQFLPVLDLRKRFGADPAPERKIVVVTVGDRLVGLLVDRVTEVTRIEPADLKEAPPMAVGPSSRFLAGLVKTGDRVLLLIDLDQVLAPDEQGALQTFEPPTSP